MPTSCKSVQKIVRFADRRQDLPIKGKICQQHFSRGVMTSSILPFNVGLGSTFKRLLQVTLQRHFANITLISILVLSSHLTLALLAAHT